MSRTQLRSRLLVCVLTLTALAPLAEAQTSGTLGVACGCSRAIQRVFGDVSTKVDLAPTSKLSELFAKALEAAVGGTYRTGGQSGAWTVQAFK